ncbi:hypothetical protein LOC54_05515, partial [Acetobacter sp. AN02]|uniref:hypothetical protein n=1 Tax=Acetobacter sp. AN02 TaxID=2894186 RepID=UPI0024340C45
HGFTQHKTGQPQPYDPQNAQPDRLLGRESLSIDSFHTWRQTAVLVTPEITERVSDLLETYNLSPDICPVRIGNRDMSRISVTVRGLTLPLNVLWNDGSDRRLLGFDTEKLPTTPGAPPFFVPAFHASAEDIQETEAAKLPASCSRAG